MVVMCDCGDSTCVNCSRWFNFSDEEPGNVHRMLKTKHQPGVWASARALIEDDEFPSLLEASRLRLGSLDPSPDSSRFQYAWRQWKADLLTLTEKTKLPVSCERMVRILHYRFNYDKKRMLELALPLARAVIELELRRSERERSVRSPCSDTDNETTLMTRVRSASKHKQNDVSRVIQHFIETCYPLVVLPITSIPNNLPSGPPPQPPPTSQPQQSVVPNPVVPNPVIPHDESVSAHMQPGYENQLEYFLNAPSILDFEPTANCTPNLFFSPTTNADNVQLVIPSDATEINDPDTYQESLPIEQVPGINQVLIQGSTDPLFSVTVLCTQGEVSQAVHYFKSILECENQAYTSEMAKKAGLTPWYYMWLKLGDEVNKREAAAERRGRLPQPSTRQVLCALDPIFAELECDKDFGEFTADAQVTLNTAIENGNFAAKATKGLLMLGGEPDVGGSAAYGDEFGDGEEACLARENKGLQLILEAMEVDVWTVPRLLVLLIQNRQVDISHRTVHHAVENIRTRAKNCSVTSFHLGKLLAYEMANEVGYRCNVTMAKKSLQSCLDGVFVAAEIRLECLHNLGRLVTFGIGGIGVDLATAERVLTKGVEANDTISIQYLANVRLRQNRCTEAAQLFQDLFKKDEREVFISAHPNQEKWETYRVHILEGGFEQTFLSDVRNGGCCPQDVRQERVTKEFGELMVIEYHQCL